MAPKKHFKVHSLNKHIEDTKKGLSAEAQYNKRPIPKSKVSIKTEPGTINKAIFGNESEDDESGSSSSESSDEDGPDFLQKLQVSKTSNTATPKKPAKRDEIADSDDERRSTAKNVTSAKSKRPVQSGAPSSDDTSSESESESGSGAELKSVKGEQKVRANGGPLKTEAPSSSGSTSGSDEEEEEEGDESSSDDEPDKKATATKVKGLTSSDQESSDSASDDESDDESEPAASTKPKAAITSTNGTSAATTSETSSSDEGTDDEDQTAAQAKPVATEKPVPDEPSDDASEDSSEEDADVSMHIADRQNGPRATVPDFIAPDFVLRKSDGGTNGQDVARICNQANLQGKQVWYFTVPANVPISVVQNMEIPMNQSRSGDSIFSHDGEDYGISMDSMTPKSSIQILIPSSDGTRYQSASRPIDQVMQVKKITQLGQGSGATSSVGPTPKPPARQQPEGLKARYQPYGVTSPMGQIGVDASFHIEDDTEMADAPAPAIPSGSAQSKSDKKEKKRKEKGESGTPRKGKRKHVSSEDDAVAATEQLMGENLSAETKTKKQKTERVGSPDLGSDAPPSSAVSKKQTLLVPPAIPGSTPSSKSKPSKSKPETPASKPRVTAVPVPQVPGSSQHKVSPVPIPQPGVASTPVADRDSKKSKKKKTKTPDATAKTQQSPPPSAQPAGKNSKIKLTPVPMPRLKTTG
ncbi:RNA polymerase I, subunit RPA34.5, partial [Metarhizium majus ARSEF 297]